MSETMSDSSSSSDEELNEYYDLLFERRSRPKNRNYFEETIPQYNNQEFLEHFRISRELSEDLANRFENSDYFNYQAGGNGKLTSLQHVLIFLWFAGHQTASFRDVADRFNITISSLFIVIRRLIYFISNLSNEIITWPTEREKVVIEQKFRENEFPGVIGVIDGSHVKIDKPSTDPESYINRKNYYSIQMQVVCDHKRKIRDLFVGYPGSVHDSRCFRTSPLEHDIENKCQNYYILGDSGFPCLRHLLTPYRDRGQLTRVQRLYNTKLSKNRYVIEHCFGLLKQKFRQLYHIKLRRVPDIVHFIRACCVLHNLAIDDDFPNENANMENNLLEEMPLEDNIHEDGDDDEVDDRDGIHMRDYVARNIL